MKYHSSSKILSLEAVLAKIRTWRVKENRIVFTNGCFDILHLGHIDYLEKTRGLGDKLIVGLNTDASVGRLKGADRPIKDERTRAHLLAALEFVDAVVLFDTDTPLELIQAVLPDVLVKGGDYQIRQIVGYEEVVANGGEVMTLPFIEGHSSSGLIDKIKALD